ncbi:MAG: MT-A70 family methyltransferase [Armatimonadota bacterium]|nr:MT-A70 family methyltransferase [Armatimonadota bacterium]
MRTELLLAAGPLPRGRFATIAADVPWPYTDRLPGGGRGAAKHYPLMRMPDILALPVAAIAAADAHLYLWTTNAFVEKAYEVARAWGFEPKTIITWVKAVEDDRGAVRVQIGMGHYFRGSTEHVLFAVRGRLAVRRRDIPTVYFAPRGRHSEKPDGFYADVIERASPGPRLEMFARKPRPGWTVWGNEVAGSDDDDGNGGTVRGVPVEVDHRGRWSPNAEIIERTERLYEGWREDAL